MLRHDRQEPAAADGPAARPVDGRERPFHARLGIGQGGLDPASQSGLVLRTHDRPLPERGIEGDQRQVREVIEPERFHAHAVALEDDRFHPRLRCHPGMVARSAATMPA